MYIDPHTETYVDNKLVRLLATITFHCRTHDPHVTPQTLYLFNFNWPNHSMVSINVFVNPLYCVITYADHLIESIFTGSPFQCYFDDSNNWPIG
jgi:hypothetical protein